MAGSGVGRRRDKWTAAWEVEKLTQLRADLDSALGRMLTECVRQATQTTNEASAEWMRRAGLIEELRSWALKDIEQWITERCKDDTPGC